MSKSMVLKQIEGIRQSGRTTWMLGRALADARDERKVLVVCAYYSHKPWLVLRLHELGASARDVCRVSVVPLGEIDTRLRGEEFDRVYFDHYALELVARRAVERQVAEIEGMTRASADG